MATIVGTFYSNSGGHGRITATNNSWATLRALATANGNTSNQWFHQTSYGAPTYYLYRVFMPFDTSAIPSDATIVSWSLSLYRYDAGYPFYNANSCTLHILPSTQASPTALTTADFDALTFSSKGSKTFASFSNNAYNAISGTDLTAITKSGYTKFCLTSDRDLNNSAPTGNNALYCQEVGAANPPYLTVTYTVPDLGNPIFFRGGATLG